jgi:acyl carrier protein phosphodiesterase
MNLLAHALLSPSPSLAPGVLVGNLTADWIKGKARHALRTDLAAGVTLHRRIDQFTDMHPLVEHCSTLLEPRWGRYSPVLVDILFDYVLSVNWSLYHDQDRPAFIAAAYSALRDHLHLLPAEPQRARMAADALLADDWLSTYASLEGIALSLRRLSRRLAHSGHSIDLSPAVADYLQHQESFDAAFHAFFPQLRTMLRQSDIP